MLRAIVSLFVLIAVPASIARAQPVSNDPRVLNVVTEEPGRPNIRAVYRVTISEPLEEPDLRAIADKLRPQVTHTDAVGFRFVLANVRPEERDPEAGRPFYAWRFWIKRNNTDIFTLYGISPSQAAQLVATFTPAPGERLRGFWIDHSSLLGAVALLDRKDGPVLVELASPERRILLKKMPSRRSGTWLEATYAENGKERYKADGDGTDRYGVHLPPDGTLRIHGGRYELAQKPYRIAVPFKPK